MKVIVVAAVIALALALSGCSHSFGEKGKYTKQEQERFLRTGK